MAGGAVSGLHALRPELEPAAHRMSEYAVGPWGWLMTVAFVTLAAGVWLLRQALAGDDRLRAVRGLLAVSAAGLVLSAAFPTDVTTPDAVRETVHSVASSGALLSLVAAAAWTVTRAHGAIAWGAARGPAAVATAMAVISAAISPLAHDGPWTGAVQRASYLALSVWMLLVCRAVATAASGRDERGR